MLPYIREYSNLSETWRTLISIRLPLNRTSPIWSTDSLCRKRRACSPGSPSTFTGLRRNHQEWSHQSSLGYCANNCKVRAQTRRADICSRPTSCHKYLDHRHARPNQCKKDCETGQFCKVRAYRWLRPQVGPTCHNQMAHTFDKTISSHTLRHWDDQLIAISSSRSVDRPWAHDRSSLQLRRRSVGLHLTSSRYRAL